MVYLEVMARLQHVQRVGRVEREAAAVAGRVFKAVKQRVVMAVRRKRGAALGVVALGSSAVARTYSTRYRYSKPPLQQ